MEMLLKATLCWLLIFGVGLPLAIHLLVSRQ
jgi:hypothetical protein